ncbi:hypothetical protein [Thauera sp.]|uniref:hypothetical protein n=1 Tax=Thauera sp. TaxID=1905334 RepID=UPI002B72398F|nr:hypothetical protein [Thauera sp.]HRP25391.1 hypothetical protein [Thauera sp.]
MIPLLPLALALTAGGIGANYMGAKAADRAQADAMAAERIRQGRFDQEADATNARSQNRYENIEEQRGDKADELADMFLADAGAAPQVLDTPTNTITVSRTDDEKAKRREYTDQQGRARAELLSLGDLFGDIGVGQARDMTQLSGIGGMRRGSQGVLPLELDAAAQKGAGWRLAGDVMGGLGSIATMGALGGASLPGIFGGAKTAGPALAGTNALFSLYG